LSIENGVYAKYTKNKCFINSVSYCGMWLFKWHVPYIGSDI
jgi:hypothetical protein